jgi:hypothetical protein
MFLLQTCFVNQKERSRDPTLTILPYFLVILYHTVGEIARDYAEVFSKKTETTRGFSVKNGQKIQITRPFPY